MNEIKLTELSHGSGCGCKVAPGVLDTLLPAPGGNAKYTDLLVGFENRDDAAVLRLDDKGNCLISTVDFFTPIVDHPESFGKIAAANALSDVYAMGGRPMLATAILGFPVEKVPVETIRRIIEGGRSICEEAGIPLAGGHTIDSAEPFFGLSVNGIVEEKQLKKNNTARAGDLIFLTKPLGSGIIAAAQKRGLADPVHLQLSTEWMIRLNRVGERLGKWKGVHAMTDVTGFGLLGHLIEMAEGSRCSAELRMSRIPLMDGIPGYVARFVFPDQVYRNWNAMEKKVSGINGPEFAWLCDPQTNGGLLISLDPADEQEFQELMKMEKLECALLPIGAFTQTSDTVVRIVP